MNGHHISHSSVLLCVLGTLDHVASVALAHALAVIVTAGGTIATGEASASAAIPRASHHVFAERAALLDGGLQVLVCLLLDRLCVL